MYINDITDKEEYKIIRKRNKITLKDVADYIGSDISTISRWENNKRYMSNEQVQRYVNFITK